MMNYVTGKQQIPVVRENAPCITVTHDPSEFMILELEVDVATAQVPDHLLSENYA